MITGGTFTSIGGRPLAAGIKTATEGSDLRPLWPFATTASMLSWRNLKTKQGIPATPNVPEPLVFSGFPDILSIPLYQLNGLHFREMGRVRKTRCSGRNLPAWISEKPFVKDKFTEKEKIHQMSSIHDIWEQL